MGESAWVLPQSKEERCSLCGLCVAICAQGALAMGESEPVWSDAEACDCCGLCEEICPEGAIDCAFEIVWEDEPEATQAPPREGGEHG